jgi:hypothetical protein
VTPRDDREWQRRQGSAGQTVAIDAGEDSHVLRVGADFSRIHKRRTAEWDVPPGIFTWWPCSLRYFHRTMGRQEVISVKAPRTTVNLKLEVDEMKLRKWAAKNAYTLIVMSVFFIITWAIIVGANLWAVSHGK